MGRDNTGPWARIEVSEAQRPPLILIVDDEPLNVQVLSEGLGRDFRTRIAGNGKAAIAAAQDEEPPDLILLDIMMPGLDGYEVCRKLKARPGTRDIPVIFVTSLSDERAEMRGLEVGAVDFIRKPINLRVTHARITTHIQLRQARERLAKLSREDPLTGIANRRTFDESLAREWQRNRRARAPLALVMIDIDFFKQYNDCYGHSAGDDCLIRVAGAITGAVRRPSDLAARYGGEEFVVLLSGTTLEGASKVAEAIRGRVEGLAIPHGSAPLGRVTVSCGIAMCQPSPPALPSDLLAAADRNLYLAKSTGRNCVAG